MDRFANYATLSNTLARLADDELGAVIANAFPLHHGVVAARRCSRSDSIPSLSNEFHSQTASDDRSMCGLPQYLRHTSVLSLRLRGTGFSAWRELAAT